MYVCLYIWHKLGSCCQKCSPKPAHHTEQLSDCSIDRHVSFTLHALQEYMTQHVQQLDEAGNSAYCHGLPFQKGVVDCCVGRYCHYGGRGHIPVLAEISIEKLCRD